MFTTQSSKVIHTLLTFEVEEMLEDALTTHSKNSTPANAGQVSFLETLHRSLTDSRKYDPTMDKATIQRTIENNETLAHKYTTYRTNRIRNHRHDSLSYTKTYNTNWENGKQEIINKYINN